MKFNYELFARSCIINRPTVQPTNRPTDQPTNRPTDQPTNRPTDQQTNRPGPTDQPIDQSALLDKPRPLDVMHELCLNPCSLTLQDLMPSEISNIFRNSVLRNTFALTFLMQEYEFLMSRDVLISRIFFIN